MAEQAVVYIGAWWACPRYTARQWSCLFQHEKLAERGRTWGALTTPMIDSWQGQAYPSEGNYSGSSRPPASLSVHLPWCFWRILEVLCVILTSSRPLFCLTLWSPIECRNATFCQLDKEDLRSSPSLAPDANVGLGDRLSFNISIYYFFYFLSPFFFSCLPSIHDLLCKEMCTYTFLNPLQDSSWLRRSCVEPKECHLLKRLFLRAIPDLKKIK